MSEYIIQILETFNIRQIVNNQPVFRERHKFACAPIEDSDQPAPLRRLIRVYDERSKGSYGSNVSPGGKLRHCSDCADVQTDLYLRCAQMPTCTLGWIPASLVLLRPGTSSTSLVSQQVANAEKTSDMKPFNFF